MDTTGAQILVLSTMTVLVTCHQFCFVGTQDNPQSGTPATWFLPYKHHCQCTAISFGGVYMSASSYRQVAPHYMDEPFLSEDPAEIQAYFNCGRTEKRPVGPGPETVECTTVVCSSPLGMEDGTIPNARISASSSASWAPAHGARLNWNSRWAPRRDAGSWIEVNLGESTMVSGVITQGNPPRRQKPTYVTGYKVSYKNLSSSSRVYVTGGDGNITVFTGNMDSDTPVCNLFDKSVETTIVRIEPIEWCRGVRLRLELLGCRLGD
ncbi:EGF-like repeat and discoidin I-like domain-containing protein 3 [Acanthaster planci]|uniref:EGF-like repeat and discoidin I-like domain-containing protein 3 n=1 Tax=Acanthaster planci TaxID=133434 RepID=A0A8B7Z896_ACAPL|nr:EGF-like repeat and discoidin I-like domain-containing protein 3 [Acanthaster planci]